MCEFRHITKAKKYMLENIRYHTDYQTLEVNTTSLAEDAAQFMDYGGAYDNYPADWIAELADEIGAEEEEKLQAVYQLSERHDIRLG
jgi:hypothetical protein